jgi:hypothetical protein
MIRIQPKHGPVKAGRLMSGEELNKILLMINAKVKKGIVNNLHQAVHLHFYKHHGF